MDQMTVYNAGLAAEMALGDSLVALQSESKAEEVRVAGAVAVGDVIIPELLRNTFAARGFTVVDLIVAPNQMEFAARLTQTAPNPLRALLDG